MLRHWCFVAPVLRAVQRCPALIAPILPSVTEGWQACLGAGLGSQKLTYLGFPYLAVSAALKEEAEVRDAEVVFARASDLRQKLWWPERSME